MANTKPPVAKKTATLLFPAKVMLEGHGPKEDPGISLYGSMELPGTTGLHHVMAIRVRTNEDEDGYEVDYKPEFDNTNAYNGYFFESGLNSLGNLTSVDALQHVTVRLTYDGVESFYILWVEPGAS